MFCATPVEPVGAVFGACCCQGKRHGRLERALNADTLSPDGSVDIKWLHGSAFKAPLDQLMREHAATLAGDDVALLRRTAGVVIATYGAMVKKIRCPVSNKYQLPMMSVI